MWPIQVTESNGRAGRRIWKLYFSSSEYLRGENLRESLYRSQLFSSAQHVKQSGSKQGPMRPREPVCRAESATRGGTLGTPVAGVLHWHCTAGTLMSVPLWIKGPGCQSLRRPISLESRLGAVLVTCTKSHIPQDKGELRQETWDPWHGSLKARYKKATKGKAPEGERSGPPYLCQEFFLFGSDFREVIIDIQHQHWNVVQSV